MKVAIFSIPKAQLFNTMFIAFQSSVVPHDDLYAFYYASYVAHHFVFNLFG